MQSGCLDGKVKSIFAKHDLLTYTLLLRGSTIGEGGDTTISSPGRSPKRPLPGMRLHDPLHGRQACPKFIAFDQGVGQICPRSGLFSYRSLPKRGQICYTPPPPPLSLNLSAALSSCFTQQGIMVNRDFMCIIWFGFIKWRITKDMIDGKNMMGYTI